MKHRELIVLVIAVMCFGSRANDVRCTLCEAAVHNTFNAAQKLHNNIANHPQLLQDVCNQIYTQSRCQVEFKPILDQIAVSMSSGHAIPANSICAALKLCQAATATVSNSNSENVNDIKGSLPQEPKTDLGCSICNGVVAKLKKLVGFQATKDLVHKSLGSICNQIQVADWCNKALVSKLDVITNSIAVDDSPSETCSKAKICAPAASTAPFFGIPRDTCLMCQNTIQRVEMAVSFFGHTPESTGMNELICRDPGFKDKCTQVILPNLGTIVTDLVLGEQSSTICNKLNLCLHAPNMDEIAAAFEEIPQLKCSSCQAVVHTLKVSLQGNTSDAKVQHGLQNLCAITPLKGTCTVLKTLFTERALDIRSDVHHICEGAKYCDPIPVATQTCRSVEQFSPPLTRSLPLFMNDDVGTPSPIFGLDAGCQACQWLASAVEAYLSQESTEEELARVLQELCTALPPEYAKVCQNFVSVYLSEALVYLLDKVTPPFICAKLLQCL